MIFSLYFWVNPVLGTKFCAKHFLNECEILPFLSRHYFDRTRKHAHSLQNSKCWKLKNHKSLDNFSVKNIFLLFLLALSSQVFAQNVVINEQWWDDLVGWDGVSHWSEYQIHSSAFLGPNALPIPALSDGKVNNVSALTTGGQFHFSDGDNTQNIALYLNYNFLKDVISVD